MLEIKQNNYTVLLDEPILYVDNESRGRSGHMTHAMAEWAPGKLIDFNSNCTAKRYGGHSTFGWIEYRTSEDGGETFSDIRQLPFSIQSFIDGNHVISVEKAVACSDGTVVAICLQNETTALCQPWDVPMVVTSTDGGESWSEARPLCGYKGRVYDACVCDDVIYVLEFCNDGTGHFCGEKEEHVYRIFTSHDSGKTFSELCVVPVPSMGRGYGSMLFDSEGRLHVYAYNVNDERHMDHIISEDGGRSWGEPDTCYLAHGIRNPQTALMDEVYILHGRAENCTGFVLYTSEDGSVWDEGTYIGDKTNYCYYSNNIVLKDPAGGNRLLMQYSESYDGECVNVFHRWLKIVR